MPFGLENGFNGVLRHWGHDYRNKKVERCTLEGLRVDFTKHTNLSLNLKIGYVRVLTRQKHEYEGPQVNFSKQKNICPLNLKLAV